VFFNPLSDPSNVVAACDPFSEVSISFIRLHLQAVAVEVQECLRRDPGNAFISIEESLILRKRLHERRGFQGQRRICVLTEGGLSRPIYRGHKGCSVTQNRDADERAVKVEHVVFGK